MISTPKLIYDYLANLICQWSPLLPLPLTANIDWWQFISKAPLRLQDTLATGLLPALSNLPLPSLPMLQPNHWTCSSPEIPWALHVLPLLRTVPSPLLPASLSPNACHLDCGASDTPTAWTFFPPRLGALWGRNHVSPLNHRNAIQCLGWGISHLFIEQMDQLRTCQGNKWKVKLQERTGEGRPEERQGTQKDWKLQSLKCGRLRNSNGKDNRRNLKSRLAFQRWLGKQQFPSCSCHILVD